jgi:hypothetical protein
MLLPSKILFCGSLALLTIGCLALPADDTKTPGVTVKSDGDNLVLIPDDPGKTFLVFGFPSGAGDGKAETGSVVRLPYQAGEQRLPAKEFEKFLILEVRPIMEVDVQRGVEMDRQQGGPGFLWAANVCKPSTCVVPVPPWPPSGRDYPPMEPRVPALEGKP